MFSVTNNQVLGLHCTELCKPVEEIAKYHTTRGRFVWTLTPLRSTHAYLPRRAAKIKCLYL